MSAPADWCPASGSNGGNGEGPPPPVPGVDDLALRPGLMSNLCSKGWRPILITGLVKDLLVHHFSAPGQIEEYDLRRYIWHDGPDTGILIESVHRWRGDLVEKRPAIVIKRNGYQNTKFVLGDIKGHDSRGQPNYVTGWVGSHTAFCLHGSGAGAELLATEVYRELHHFHPVIVRQLGLLRWGVTEVGEVGEIEEARESFTVPVTVGWAYQDTWAVELETPKLRRIALSKLLTC